MCFSEGKGVRRDYAEAIKWFKKAAEQKNPDALYQLGLASYEGKGVPLDLDEAIKWFKKAAKKGNADAQEKLDSMKELVELYESAKKGNSTALFNLGAAYYFGQKGVQTNEEEAIKWWKKAAEAGVLEAQYNLGAYYHNHHRYSAAAEWYRKAAEQGEVEAMNKLAFYYEFGEGVRRDMNEAIKWWKKAAGKGNSDAMVDLGDYYLMLYTNEGREEAIKWYRKAAALGNFKAIEALSNLGIKDY